MKKGDRRIHVDVLDKKTKKKIGEKDIYITNPYSGSGAFNMSWQDRNKMPRPDSKRQQKLREEREKIKKILTESKGLEVIAQNK